MRQNVLLNILGGLDTPSEGLVTARGEPLAYGDHAAMAAWRSLGVGFIFQFHFLLPDYTALENLLLPVRSRGPIQAADRERALSFLETMEMTDRADHLPGELSGGDANVANWPGTGAGGSGLRGGSYQRGLSTMSSRGNPFGRGFDDSARGEAGSYGLRGVRSAP